MTLIAPVDSKVEKGTPVDLEDCLKRFFGEEEIPGFDCSNCKTKRNFTKRQRFISYPRTLVIVLQRFVFDEWVPKKLDIELQVPETTIDFERFRGHNA